MASFITRLRRKLRAGHYERKTVESLCMVKPTNVWRFQPWFVSAMQKYSAHVPGIPEMRCFFLQSAIRALDGVDGAVAECGTRNGKSALFMLEAAQRARDFYLFDSFEGLSDPVKGKDTIETSFEGDKRIFHTDFDAVVKRFEPFPNVHIMQGWIPDRFAEIADRTFALIHIDVDMYQPTLDSLEFFYPRMVKGGYIICDDYGSAHYPGSRAAMDEFFADKPEKPVEMPSAQAFVVKG